MQFDTGQSLSFDACMICGLDDCDAEFHRVEAILDSSRPTPPPKHPGRFFYVEARIWRNGSLLVGGPQTISLDEAIALGIADDAGRPTDGLAPPPSPVVVRIEGDDQEVRPEMSADEAARAAIARRRKVKPGIRVSE